MKHPADDEGTAAGDYVCNSGRFSQTAYRFLSYAAVDSHEIDSVFCLLLDHGEEIVNWHSHYRSPPVDGLDPRLVDGNSAQGKRSRGDDSTADSVDIAAGAQVHYRVSLGGDRRLQLLQLAIDIAVVRRSADVGVDLCAQPLSNSTGLYPFVVYVGRDHDRAIGHP